MWGGGWTDEVDSRRARRYRVGGVFFFNDTATTEIYTLSLHDALPICQPRRSRALHGLGRRGLRRSDRLRRQRLRHGPRVRSEEHTSELQSHSFISYAVFCLKKKTNTLFQYAFYYWYSTSDYFISHTTLQLIPITIHHSIH